MIGVALANDLSTYGRNVAAAHTLFSVYGGFTALHSGVDLVHHPTSASWKEWTGIAMGLGGAFAGHFIPQEFGIQTTEKDMVALRKQMIQLDPRMKQYQFRTFRSKKLLGLHDPLLKTIFINTNDHHGPASILHTALHETGHAVYDLEQRHNPSFFQYVKKMGSSEEIEMHEYPYEAVSLTCSTCWILEIQVMVQDLKIIRPP